MKVWERRLIVALIALAFALLIYSYFTDKSVFYSPGADVDCEDQRDQAYAGCAADSNPDDDLCLAQAYSVYNACLAEERRVRFYELWCRNHFC